MWSGGTNRPWRALSHGWVCSLRFLHQALVDQWDITSPISPNYCAFDSLGAIPCIFPFPVVRKKEGHLRDKGEYHSRSTLCVERKGWDVAKHLQLVFEMLN